MIFHHIVVGLLNHWTLISEHASIIPSQVLGFMENYSLNLKSVKTVGRFHLLVPVFQCSNISGLPKQINYFPVYKGYCLVPAAAETAGNAVLVILNGEQDNGIVNGRMVTDTLGEFGVSP